MELINLRVHCLNEALKYIGNTNKGAHNVVEVARVFEEYLSGAVVVINHPKDSAPPSDNVLQFRGVLQ